MNHRHGAVELDWADGTFTFRLGLREIEELEEKRNTSLFTLAARLSPAQRSARLLDITETLRLGLLGGGMPAIDALAKVRRYAEERPLDESRDVAYVVAMAGLARVHPGDLGTAETDDASGNDPGGAPAA